MSHLLLSRSLTAGAVVAWLYLIPHLASLHCLSTMALSQGALTQSDANALSTCGTHVGMLTM